MKKKLMYFTYLSMFITGIVLLGIAGTYLSDHLNSIGWYGDHGNDWGARKIWYTLGTIALFITSGARFISWSAGYWEGLEEPLKGEWKQEPHSEYPHSKEPQYVCQKCNTRVEMNYSLKCICDKIK